MKHFTLYLFFLMIPWAIKAQIGINTINPQKGAIHIDSKSNNPSTVNPSRSESIDDVFIDTNGYTGIGTTSPSNQVHIRPTLPSDRVIMIQDGNQANTKLFGSDDQGVGTWKYAGEIEIVRGKINSGVTLQPINYTQSISFENTNAHIDLPPGQWLVTTSMKITLTNTEANNASSLWVRSTFSDTPGGLASSDIVGAFLISGVGVTSMPNSLNGFIVINNTANNIKRYYYSVGWFTFHNKLPSTTVLDNYASNTVNENYILAFKMVGL